MEKSMLLQPFGMESSKLSWESWENWISFVCWKKDREKVMEEVDKVRAKSVHSHSPADCSDGCKARGEMGSSS